MLSEYNDLIAGINWDFILPLWIILLVTGQIRYGFLAGCIHLICTVTKREKWYRYRVQLPFVEKKQLKSELKWSVVTGLVFSTMEFLVVLSNSFGLTQLYPNISDRGIPYFIFSVVAMIVLHDAYFYWSHRLLHWKPLFWIHKIHHDSVSTSAFTSFNFHPIEAFLQFSILPIAMFIMPVHWYALTIFLTYMTLFNILWHNSYEFWPQGHVRNRWLNFFSTPTHHNLHHQRVKCNYALYFTYWDRLMGTLHPNYEEIYDEVKGRAAEVAPEPTPG